MFIDLAVKVHLCGMRVNTSNLGLFDNVMFDSGKTKTTVLNIMKPIMNIKSVSVNKAKASSK